MNRQEFIEYCSTLGEEDPITRDMIVGHVRFVFFPFGNFRGVE